MTRADFEENAAISRADFEVDFEERAAILEFDNGMTRAAAESQALREILDLKLAVDPPGILGELARASRRRHHPDLAPVLAALGLANVRGPAWGFAHVVADGENYRPALDDAEPAHAALIVPAVKDGGVDDLVACTIVPRRMRSRLGVAAVVGFDEIGRARVNGRPLFVFNDSLAWLHGGALGVAVVDWARTVEIFDGIPLLMCSASMVDRLKQATANCWQPPTVAIGGRPRAA